MNHISTIFILLILLVFACDIPGKLSIQNNTERNGFYIYELLIDNDSTKLITVEIPSEERKTILLGFGQQWTDKGIQNYLEKINYIEIISFNDTLRLENKEEMTKYFKKRRKGLFKDKIKIIIN